MCPGIQRNRANNVPRPISVFVNYRLADGTFFSITRSIDDNGPNFLGITSNGGEIFTSAGFTADPTTTGIGELKQLRRGGVAAFGAVSELASWMLIGMAAVGLIMRRKVKTGLPVRFA